MGSDDKEDKYGNRDPISRYQARMERAYSDEDFARMIRGGPDADATRAGKAIGLIAFIVVMILAAGFHNDVEHGRTPILPVTLGILIIAWVGMLIFGKK